MSEHDRQLLVRMRRGDEVAARELWVRFATRLTAYARAILSRHDPDGAPDVVQQVFMAALRAPKSEAAGVQEPGAWLMRLTRNLALNRLRSLRRERARLGRSSPQEAAGEGFDARTDLRFLVDALPRPLREVIVLRHVAGLAFDEIATALDANRNTVASRYRRAVSILREKYSSDPTPASEVIHAEP